VVAAFTTLAGLTNAEAQVNERRVERDATGVYKGKLVKGIRIRKLVTGNERIPISNSQGKLRVPVKNGKLKTRLKDGELEGDTNKAILKGREQKSKVSRQGKKIAYVAKGEMDVLGDGHNPYKRGVIRGPFVKRGSKWIASTKTTGRRLDNDGNTSCYKGKGSGKH